MRVPALFLLGALGIAFAGFTLYYQSTKTSSPPQEAVSVMTPEKKEAYQSLSPKVFWETYQSQKPKAILIDLRRKEEIESGYIPEAKLLDFYDPNFIQKLSLLEKDRPYFIYCRSGNRSKQTMKIMKDLTFEKVYNLQGGIKQWKAENLPLTLPTETPIEMVVAS